MSQFSGTANPSQSGGVTAIYPMDFYQFKRDPTPNDSRGVRYYRPGDHWENTTNNNLWYLANLKNNVALWILIAGGNGDINSLQPQISGVNNGAVVTPILGLININNTDLNIVPSNGGANTLNLNFAPVINVVGSGGGTATITSNTTFGVALLDAINSSNDTNPSVILLDKNRAGGTVVSGDALGYIYFRGFDGTNYQQSGLISVTNTGVVSAGKVAGNMIFWTTPAATGVLTPRMAISSTGVVTINQNDSGPAALVVNANINAVGNIISLGNGSAGSGNFATINGGINLGDQQNTQATANDLQFIKTRAGATLQTGDDMGDIAWIGWDGANTVESALIRGTVDPAGSVAVNQVPGKLSLYTHPNSVTAMNVPNLRMTIDCFGQVVINAPDTPASQYSLTVVQDVKAKTFYATGDDGGVASTVGISNVGSTTISTGVGSVKMSSVNAATNSAWIKVYFGTTAYWIPAWTTNSP